MRTAVATSMAIFTAGSAPFYAHVSHAELDPSLRVIHSHAYITVADTLPALVLDYGGILLTWDESSEEFSLWIDSEPVANLITDASNLSFSGNLDGQSVSGYVDSGASGFYDVYYAFGSEKPPGSTSTTPTGRRASPPNRSATVRTVSTSAAKPTIAMLAAPAQTRVAARSVDGKWCQANDRLHAQGM